MLIRLNLCVKILVRFCCRYWLVSKIRLFLLHRLLNLRNLRFSIWFLLKMIQLLWQMVQLILLMEKVSLKLLYIHFSMKLWMNKDLLILCCIIRKEYKNSMQKLLIKLRNIKVSLRKLKLSTVLKTVVIILTHILILLVIVLLMLIVEEAVFWFLVFIVQRSQVLLYNLLLKSPKIISY